MPKSTACIQGLLLLLFNATTFADLAENDTTSPAANLYASLHTATPAVAGTQTTNEIGYTSYDRVAVARTSGGWALTTDHVNPVAAITFPAGTGGAGTATYFAVGVNDFPTAGVVLYFGTVTPNIICGDGITPSLSTASSITEA